MARTTNNLWRVIIPLILSVLLSASAFHFMMRRLTNAKPLKIDEKCPVPWTGAQPYQRTYLGGYAPPLEQLLCILVAFFDTLFKPEASQSSPFLYDFIISFVAPVTVTYFEASRTNRPLLVGFPLVVGLLYQTCGGGVILPLYWGLFVATTSRKAIGSQIDQASAEAVLFGIGMGYALPTLAMIYFPTIETIALWQPFPVWISVFQYMHLLIRPRRSHGGSGHRTVQATYLLIFLVSTVTHISAMSAYNFEPQTVLDTFFPTIAEPEAKGATALTSCLHFLQWDMVYIFGSTLLASVWLAEGMLQGILLVTWSVVSSVALGPGAAVAGIFLWRERSLKGKREKQVSAIKASKAY